jgi:eukaryotic-like serine/threonine-protein kinase
LVIEKGAVVAGRYRLLEQVGSGAMGVVWKAKDERLGRIVAVKRLLVRYALSEGLTEDTRRRAMREARIAARLQHRNAIAMFDVVEHEGDPCLIMEFLPSRSLSAVLAERGTLPPEEVAEIGAQVATALAAAHAVGIAHRDVKPGNILLADNGTVKITDFGISRALDDGTVTTQTGMLAGTPAYLAPEIARGGDPTRASDVFSLGSTLYHALEGRPPFGSNTNPFALLHKVASGNVPPPRNAGPLGPTLMSLMRTEPAERPTMEQAAAALAVPTDPSGIPVLTIPVAAAAKSATPTPSTASAPTKPSQPQSPAPVIPTAVPTPSAAAPRPPAGTGARSNRNLLVVAIVAVLVLAGTVVVILTSRDSGDGGNNANEGGGATTSQEQQDPPSEPPSEGETSESAPVDVGTSPADGAIGYSEAGILVIAYYGDIENAAARWAMLSPHAQALFGGQQAFNEYWAQYTDVSSRDAIGVTPNEDGSVNVPVNVTYTSASGPAVHQRVLRVTRINGQLRIDSDAK